MTTLGDERPRNQRYVPGKTKAFFYVSAKRPDRLAPTLGAVLPAGVQLIIHIHIVSMPRKRGTTPPLISVYGMVLNEADGFFCHPAIT
jgi:hypothetical protein